VYDVFVVFFMILYDFVWNMKSQVPLPDLIQQVNLGLLDSVERYNPNRGTKFTSYAVFRIRNSICLF
jgi:DNA-directed RNA polymerase specialized sigma subunit